MMVMKLPQMFLLLFSVVWQRSFSLQETNDRGLKHKDERGREWL